MTKIKDIISISPELQKSIDNLQSLKVNIDEMAVAISNIKIVDESSLAIGQQNLSKANNLLTLIESKRKTIKEPYLEAGKLIDSAAKMLTEELNKSVQSVKGEIAAWEKKRLNEEKAKQAEIDLKLAQERQAIEAEEKRKSDIRDYIKNKALPTLQKMYSECDSITKCEEKLRLIESGYKPREFFQEFVDEAYSLRDNYVDLIKAKLKQLSDSVNMSDGEMELAAEKERIALEKANMAIKEAELKAKEEELRLQKEKREAEITAQQEKERLAEESLANKTKGVRYIWDFEVVDIDAIPRDWLVLDENKTKEYLKHAKDNIKEDHVFNGVRFFKKMGITA